MLFLLLFTLKSIYPLTPTHSVYHQPQNPPYPQARLKQTAPKKTDTHSHCVFTLKTPHKKALPLSVMLFFTLQISQHRNLFVTFL